MAENTGKVGVSYVRTSTAGQKDKKTINAQRAEVERIRALPQYRGVSLLKYGPRCDGRLEDDGRSAYLLEGRELGPLIDDLEAGRIHLDFLFMPETSRTSRPDTFDEDLKVQLQSGIDDLRINTVLRFRKVKVVTSKGEFDDLRQESLENSHERDKIRRRTMIGKLDKAAEGAYVRGRVPYGWNQDGTVNDDEHRSLLRIYSWYLYHDQREQGGYAYAAREAEKAGVPNPDAKFGRQCEWSQKTVEALVLRARVYLSGEVTTMLAHPEDRTRRVPFKTKFPTLITRDLYDRIERRRRERTLKAKATFLPSGFCVCGGCRANLIIKNGTDRVGVTRHYARCPGKCGSMREEAFATVLWTAAVCRYIHIKQHEKKKSGHRSADAYEKDMRVAKAAVADAQRQIDVLAEMALNGLDIASWKPQNDALNRRKLDAQGKVADIDRERDERARKAASEQNVETRVGALLDELANFPQPPLGRKREVLAELLAGERVIVAWPSSKPKVATMTLPAFGELPPVTVRSDQAPWRVLGGAVVHADQDLWKLYGDRIKDGEVSLMVRPAKSSRYVLGLQTPSGVLSGEGFIPLVAAEVGRDEDAGRRRVRRGRG